MGKWITQDEIDNAEENLVKVTKEIEELKQLRKKSKRKKKSIQDRLIELRKQKDRIYAAMVLGLIGSGRDTTETIAYQMFEKDYKDLTPDEKRKYDAQRKKEQRKREKGANYKRKLEDSLVYKMFGKRYKELTLDEKHEYDRIIQKKFQDSKR